MTPERLAQIRQLQWKISAWLKDDTPGDEIIEWLYEATVAINDLFAALATVTAERDRLLIPVSPSSKDEAVTTFTLPTQGRFSLLRQQAIQRPAEMFSADTVRHLIDELQLTQARADRIEEALKASESLREDYDREARTDRIKADRLEQHLRGIVGEFNVNDPLEELWDEDAPIRTKLREAKILLESVPATEASK